MVSTILNNTYRLERALTKGGMGQVFVASHLRMAGRQYAIKQLHPELAVAPNFQVRFQREAEVMMTLDHPHIVRIEDFLIENATYYLIMEFVEGDSLDQKLQREHKIAPEECHRLTLELLDGLEYCHSQGIIHRDLKPSNLLLTRDHRLKITDFGIALQENSEQRLTNTGTILGTPDYMSPEQIVGKPLDGRSDLYAVGAILYEMLLGQSLFPRGDEDQGSYVVLFSHVHKPPPPIVAPHIPMYLRQIIERCLQKDPNHRFASARDMMQTMIAAQGEIGAHFPSRVGQGVSSQSLQIPGETKAFQRTPLAPSGRGSVHPPVPVGEVAVPVSVTSLPSPKKRSGMLGFWIVLLLFLVGGGVGLWFWPDGQNYLLSVYRKVVGEEVPTGTSQTNSHNRQNPIDPNLSNRQDGVPDGTNPSVRDPVGADSVVPEQSGSFLTIQRETEPAPPRNPKDPQSKPKDPVDPKDPQSKPKDPVDTKDPQNKPKDPVDPKDPQSKPPTLRREPEPRTKPSIPDQSGNIDVQQEAPLTSQQRKKLMQVSWPLPVSGQCKHLLLICVRRCLKAKEPPTLSFAQNCRKRCWRTRILSFKGQQICPSDQDE